MEGGRVLVADDEMDVVEALRLLLKRAGHHVLSAASPAELVATVEREELDVVLMDLNYARDTTSGREGLDTLARLLAIDPTLPVLVMTAWSSVDNAVEAMRIGARDYLEKPWDNHRLLQTIRTQIELARTVRQNRRLEREASRLRARDLPEIIAESQGMQALLRLAARVAPADAQVLIAGEHGTGKEVIARWLHSASGRSARPFVAVNAGGVNDGTFESELFGHVKGAFTDARSDRAGCFELAEGGTLFLDEIANMPLNQQARLLRVLQTGDYHPVGSSRVRHVDVRFVAATNADLREEVAQGRFREDLLYRINTVEINIPPLRERREDIAPLARHFAERISTKSRKVAPSFSTAALNALEAHRWPGNVRELEHVIERALLLVQGPSIEVEDLALNVSAKAREPLLEDMTLEEVERHLIRRALSRTNGHVGEASTLLGLSRSALYRRLQHFGIKGQE